MSFIPQSPPLPNHPPRRLPLSHPPHPQSPLGARFAKEKAKLPLQLQRRLSSYMTAPGACVRASGPYRASSYSTCYFFFTLLLLPPLSFSSDSSRPAPASSPNAGWQSCHAILVLFSLSFLKWPVGPDQVRPGQTRQRQWREARRPCPERESNYITVLAVDGLSSKVCLPDCRAPPCQLGLKACVAQWNPERGNLVGGLPTGPGYFGRVPLADRLPCWSLAGQSCGFSAWPRPV